jgi:3',5'-cyclic AMP phosphodiesterase CpdA
MPLPFTLAHLTDVHLSPIAGFTPRHWNLKRALGYANWVRHRRDSYDAAVLARIVADLKAQAPGHIAVTGDLVNIGLPQEHINALAWLEGVGSPAHVSVVPGNHDIYSHLRGDPGSERWARYMTSDAAGLVYAGHAERFPYVRRLGPIALVGINSAVPTPPLLASGRLGASQLARIGPILDRLGRDGLFRLVLIHHPPLPGQASRLRGLEDAAQMQGVLQRHGAELVIHGHNHHNMLAWSATPDGHLPVVGAPAAALARLYKGEPLARYNLYTIARPPWRIELVGRGLAEPDGPIVELERRPLLAPGA